MQRDSSPAGTQKLHLRHDVQYWEPSVRNPGCMWSLQGPGLGFPEEVGFVLFLEGFMGVGDNAEIPVGRRKDQRYKGENLQGVFGFQ